MTEPTTGERIVMDTLEYDLKTLRTTARCGALLAIAHAIDAAIAEAVKAEREACAAVADEQQKEPECPERASYIAEAIRARGNP